MNNHDYEAAVAYSICHKSSQLCKMCLGSLLLNFQFQLMINATEYKSW